MKPANNFDLKKFITEGKLIKENKEINKLITSGFKEKFGGNYYYEFTIPFSTKPLDYVAYQPKINSNEYYIIDAYGQELKKFDTLDEMISHLKTYMNMHQ